jgi:hypothetical protein
MDVQDRLSITGEFFYNGTGYTNNVLSDPNAALFMELNGLYVPNYNSLLYAALFASYNEFILSDMSLSMNVLGNLVDGSFIVASSLSYSPVNHFSISFGVNGFVGNDNTEYTLGGTAISPNLSISMAF